MHPNPTPAHPRVDHGLIWGSLLACLQGCAVGTWATAHWAACAGAMPPRAEHACSDDCSLRSLFRLSLFFSSLSLSLSFSPLSLLSLSSLSPLSLLSLSLSSLSLSLSPSRKSAEGVEAESLLPCAEVRGVLRQRCRRRWQSHDLDLRLCPRARGTRAIPKFKSRPIPGPLATLCSFSKTARTSRGAKVGSATSYRKDTLNTGVTYRFQAPKSAVEQRSEYVRISSHNRTT